MDANDAKHILCGWQADARNIPSSVCEIRANRVGKEGVQRARGN